MPKIALSDADSLERERYINEFGYKLTVADVGKILGLKHYNSARKWLMGMKSWNINGIYRYDIDDIMDKLAASRRKE